MKVRNKIVSLVILLHICAISFLHAQTFTASASASTVAVGQEFEVSFTLKSNGAGFKPPGFEGFSVYSGPNQSTSVEMVNGNFSQSISISYVLAAQAEGTYTIDPASINIGGKTVSSNPLTIKVIKGSSPQNSATPQASTTAAPAAPGNNSTTTPTEISGDNKNLFIRLNMSKSKVYVGEQVTLTAKLYTRMNLESVSQESAPDYSGFYSQDVPQAQKGQLSQSRENIDGVQYVVAILSQTILIPQRSGKLVIDPLSIEVVADEPVKSNNIFDQFFGGSYRRVPYTVKSEKVSVEVQPLPKTDKAFSGAVGDFTLKGELDRDNVKANDAINLTYTISGNGNIKLIDSIPVSFPPDFDHYDPKITDHISATASGVSGTRTFNYLLIPRHAGSFKIPEVNLAYFNPGKRSYVNLNIPEMDVEVAKGDNTQSSVQLSGPVSKEDVKLLGSDIRFIHLDHEPVYNMDTYFLYSFPFFAGILSPVLAFIGFLFVRRKYIEQRNDVVGTNKRRATKMAKKRLTIAHQSIAANNKELFYEELLKALDGYLSNKFTIPVSDLSRENITSTLTQKNVKPDTLQKLMNALDDCEYARYAPASVAGNLNEVYNSAVNLITQLEDEIA